MSANNSDFSLRRLPSVTRLMAHAELQALRKRLPEAVFVETVRRVLQQARTEFLASPAPRSIPAETSLATLVLAEAQKREALGLKPGINATGIVLHTGLGRARLSEAAVRAVTETARNHSLVEIEVESGRRGSRLDSVRGLLGDLTGAEDAAVVNNCAGAVFLAVNVLASGRKVLISRGELVEIGGAFRMPDIIRASGAELVEVGTTNRTRISDYRNAITPQTALILRCHPSNFAIVGFTEEASTSQLAALGQEHGIPVMDDQGNGLLFPLSEMGTPLSWGAKQGSLRESVASGADLITASGDKLLGGPQAGLILGRRELVSRIVEHPLSRALRVDKLTLAALEATLRLYRDPQTAKTAIPTLRYLLRTPDELRRLANTLARKLRAVLPSEAYEIKVTQESSQVGGGSLPGENLPTFCVQLFGVGKEWNADRAAKAFRLFTPPVFARIRQDALLFDPRTLEPEELALIA